MCHGRRDVFPSKSWSIMDDIQIDGPIVREKPGAGTEETSVLSSVKMSEQ